MWCMFELAVFTALKGQKAITWCPTFMQATYLYCFMGAWLAYTIEAVRQCADSGTFTLHTIWLRIIFIFIPICRLTHYLRQMMNEKYLAMQSLKSFDIDCAQCREAADREHIVQTIEHFYGSKSSFNETVRRKIGQDMMSAVDTVQGASLPRFVAFFPACCHKIEALISFGLRSEPRLEGGDLACYALALLVSSLALPILYVSASFTICTLFRKRCRSVVADAMLSVSLTFVWFVPILLLDLISPMVARRASEGIGFLVLTIAYIVCIPLCAGGLSRLAL